MSDSASPHPPRKRPRSEKPSSSSALSVESNTDSSISSDSSDAFYSLLVAETSAGVSVSEAIRSLFSADLSLVAPVLHAVTSSPELCRDLRSVATMCATIYQLATAGMRPGGRERLEMSLESLSDVARILERAENVVVLTGAGVSVSCGIPDFRSTGGLYESVERKYGLKDPQAIFDLEEFCMDPRLFYSFAKEIMPRGSVIPSRTHYFVSELEKRGKLLRIYSQNIDGLERRAGVSEERLVLCHGSFLTASCMRKTCKSKVSGDEIAEEVARGDVPLCGKCGKGELGDGEVDVEDMGVLKPDIVFFGENLPRLVGDNLERDIASADLLLVLGTSLQVAPVAKIPGYFGEDVPRILVNRELVGYDFDVELLGDCDVVVGELRRVLNWTEDHFSGQRIDGGNQVPVQFKSPRRFLFPGAIENEKDEDGGGKGIEEQNGTNVLENGDVADGHSVECSEVGEKVGNGAVASGVNGICWDGENGG